MDIRKPVVAGIMGLTTLMPVKAQKTVQLVSETGLTGIVSKKPSLYGGLNVIFPRNRNFTDLYAGISVQPGETPSFVGLAINDFSWKNKHISSWGRETLVVNKSGVNSILEVAPVKANLNVKNFSFSFIPSYAVYNNFGANNGERFAQGINPIIQAIYSRPKDKFFLEIKYSTTPAKSLFNTSFGNPKDNMSWMLSYMRNINIKKKH